MKKISTLLAIIIVLIVAWLGTAWYTGQRIEAETSDLVTNVNAAWAKNPGLYTPQLKQISYERGLFTSHTRFAVTSPVLPNQQLMEIDTTIWHGPFPLAAVQHGNLAPRKFQAHVELLATAGPFKMMMGAIMNGKPPFVMDAGCSYGGHCDGMGSVPPIDVDLSSIADKAKLSFGGIQTRFDFDHRSDTDYDVHGEAQLLPLSINGQNFGNGQFTLTSSAQSATEQLSWKADKGESKLNIAFALTQPLPLWGEQSVKPQDLPQLIKTASLNLSLSKPMLIDLVAHALNLTQGIDLATVQQQVGAQFDTLLTGNPQAAQFIRAQGDLLTSDWQYGDGKLLVNGQDNPELLAQIKQGYLAQLNSLEDTDQTSGADDDAASAALPAASAPDTAASASK